MEMVDILRKYIRAERTGNWDLHLQALSEMIPYLAASGHNNYTKSALIYLQRMSHLQEDHPEVYHHFQNGLHVIRRSDRYWAGLSTDPVIEQVLMRSMKTSGGLTRGRGMTEQQQIIWSLAMLACAEINRAMQELTGVMFNSGEQNKDITQARQARDWKDTQTVLLFLQKSNPFIADPSLRNICTGVHGQSSVNVETAKAIGTAILTSMEDKTVIEYTFKKTNQVVTLATKTRVIVDDASLQIDPLLLFQRLTIAARTSTEDNEKIFKYELCSYPPALFDSSLLLREPQKSVLANSIWNCLTQECPEIPEDVAFVLDGGSLLQRIPWRHGMTYREICIVYVSYVLKKYGKAIVVFDGYNQSSTKDMVHQRRSKGKTGVVVTFTDEMKLTMKKETFLTNNTNKQRFIYMLGKYLDREGCKVYHAPEDADVLIVNKAVEAALVKNTVLIGEDTDLLILLCYHASLQSCDIFFRSETKKGTKRPRVWSIKSVKQQLGPELCKNLLFLHAISGCDTTSQLYRIGKGNSLKKFRSNQKLREQAKIFNNELSSSAEISAAGEKALIIFYNGKPDDSLDSLRYKRFCEKVSTNKSHIHPQTLPPTSAAAKYHSFRVYYQIMKWKGINDITPLKWGWKNIDDKLMPVTTDLSPAPEDLLKIIRCNCHGDCSTMRCTCKKHNIDCSPACGSCRGSGCSNSRYSIDSEQDDTDDEDDYYDSE